ncbi:hypothetical protein HON52_04475 [Candidatus Uhrbacteria bacterium]|jgi:hypothetical protein|nr:hypothetical protein [Candidatus Uhrbacteria bacterium]
MAEEPDALEVVFFTDTCVMVPSTHFTSKKNTSSDIATMRAVDDHDPVIGRLRVDPSLAIPGHDAEFERDFNAAAIRRIL